MLKSENKFWKKALASFAVGGVILSGLVLGGGASSNVSPMNPIVDASAGVAGGGTGSGGGGGGTRRTGRWLQIPKAKLDNGSVKGIPAEYRNDPVCHNAIAYYAIVPNMVNDSRAQNGSWGYTLHGVKGLNGVSFPGGPGIANAIANNVGSSYDWAAGYLHQKNFICLDNPNVVTTSEWRYEVRGNGSSSDSLDETGAYEKSTTVKPQFVGGSKDLIGKENLHEQPAVKTGTHFATVFNDFERAIKASGANSKNIVAQFKPRFADAKRKDNETAPSGVTLDQANIEGIAEGGILNISEWHYPARATASTTTSNYQVWRCGFDHYSRTGWQPSRACEPVGGNINPDALPTHGLAGAVWLNWTERGKYTPTTPGATSWQRFSSSSGSSRPTQRQVGFWQIISAHCNEPGIAALREAMGSGLTTLNSGDATGSISGLLRTNVYPQTPSPLPLGSTNSSLPPAQRATGSLGFFDKECPFDCTPNREGPGASADNGAISNVSRDNFAQTSKGLYGSKINNEVNSNYSEIFRDNVERTIRPDVWYPVSGNGVSYTGEAPKTTLVTRWSGGTPVLGDEFNAYAVKGEEKIGLFNPKVTAQENQRNFDVATGFASSTGGQVPGLVEEIAVKSTWASDSGKPQALQVAWEYSPSVTSIAPVKLGFRAGTANARVETWTNVVTKVDGRCWGEFGTPNQTTRNMAKTELSANTGTGASTNFTVPNGDHATARNLIMNFIRGASE